MILLKMKVHLSAFRKYAECLNFLHALCKYEHESGGRLKSDARTSSFPAYSSHQNISPALCTSFVSTVRPIGILTEVSMPKKTIKVIFLSSWASLIASLRGHIQHHICAYQRHPANWQRVKKASNINEYNHQMHHISMQMFLTISLLNRLMFKFWSKVWAKIRKSQFLYLTVRPPNAAKTYSFDLKCCKLSRKDLKTIQNNSNSI